MSNFKLIWIGQIAFLLLFLLAAFFYLERVIFADSSYFAFTVIYEKDFHYSVTRFASQIPQIISLIGVWLNMPLKVLLFLFSISYILLFYLVFLITAYVLKNKRLALAIPFILLMGTKYSFYWCVTETHQALVYCVLLAAFLFYSTRIKPGIIYLLIKVIVATVIIFLSFFSHPVAFFPILFILGFFLVDQKIYKEPFVYILIVIVMVAMIINVFFLSVNTYDSHQYESLFGFYGKINNIFESFSYLFIIENIFTIYLFSLLIFAITCIFYILKKDFIKLGYYTLSVLIFLMVIFLTFPWFGFDFIQEKNINPLNVFLLIPFFHDVMVNEMKLKKLKVVFLGLFLIISVVHISMASPFYQNRLKYIKQVTDLTRKFPEKKFLMGKNDVDKKSMEVTWAFGTETLLLTSLESPDSSRTIYIPENNEIVFVNLNDPDIYICARWAPDVSIKGMDSSLFNLGQSGYRKLLPDDIYLFGKTIYSETFEKSEKNPEKYDCDSTGTCFYIFDNEFSPGYGEFLSKISSDNNINIRASAKVSSYNDVNTVFGLVISRANGENAYEYYHSSNLKESFFPKNKWVNISVTGVVNSLDSNDYLKVYVWNPTRQKFRIDEIHIDYLHTSPGTH